jgi:hypothetical protein
VLWPAAILVGLAVLNGAAGLFILRRPFYRRMGLQYWDGIARSLGDGMQRPLSEMWGTLMHQLPVEPGRVAQYFWPGTVQIGLADLVLAVAALIALLLTLKTWVPAAASRQAGASARLVRALIGPLLACAALDVWMNFISSTSRTPRTEWWWNVLFFLGSWVWVAWSAAAMGAVLTAVSRAAEAQDPWAPRALAWGALRTFRALFVVSAFFYAGQMLVILVPESWQGVVGQGEWLLGWWAEAALLMAAIIVVADGAGALQAARMALLAWRRAPYHLIVVILAGVVIVWACAWLGWAVAGGLAALVGPVPVGVGATLVGYAVRGLLMIWATMTGVLLWRRVRERVVGPGTAEAAVS